MDSNHRSRRRQIYSLLPLTAREPNHSGAGERNRTFNLLITSQLLYRWATPAKFVASRHLPFGWCLEAESNHPPCKRFARAVVPLCLSAGASRRNRTTDTRIFSPLLYRLSYGTIIWRSGRDSNPRPPPWQGGILTSWTTEPCWITKGFNL